MTRENEQAEYRRPPRKWPFPHLGRGAFLALGAALLALILLPFWGSIAVAAVFAFGLIQYTESASRHLGNRRRLTAALLVGVLTLLLFFPATMFSLRVYEMVSERNNQNIHGIFSANTLGHFEDAYKTVESFATRYGVGAHLFQDGGDAQEALRNAGSALFSKGIATLSAALASLPEITLRLLVFGLFLYAFLAYPREIKRFAFRLHLFRPEDLKRSIAIFQSSSHDSLVANFIVGALQASVITLGARFFGYHESVLIFSLVFVLSFIPFIGSAPVGYAISLLILLSDGTGHAIIMALVATFAGLIDNVVRPYLVSGGKNDIHPILSFAAILGAIGIFGIKGIFLGPVILTGTVAFLGRSRSQRTQKKARGGVVRPLRRARQALKEEFVKKAAP
jgi:predicted PurR-regulated permease PerM